MTFSASETKQTILLIEDNEDDVFLMKRALKEAGITNPLEVIEDGDAAVQYLKTFSAVHKKKKPAELPLVVFLDLKLPFRSGLEVLHWIRRQSSFEKLVVIVLTSSEEPVDLNKAYRQGANSYLVKPPTARQILELSVPFNLTWQRSNQTVARESQMR